MQKLNNPTNQLPVLRMMLGKKIVDIRRYDWYQPGDNYEQWKIPRKNYFKLEGVPLDLEMEDGLIVGFGSINEISSLVVTGGVRPQREHSYKFVTSAKDKIYSDDSMESLIGEKIVGIQVLKEEPRNARTQDLVRETGIVFQLESGKEFYLTYGYHDRTDALSILFKDEIPPEILERTEVIADLKT